MTRTRRTGIWIYPDAPAGQIVDAVVAADAGGVDEVWIADEGVAREPVPLLAAAAGRTDRILLGVGITTPALRHPGAIASTIATARSVLGRTPSEHYRPPEHAAPARDVPIFVGAKGEQLNRLASRAADGVFLSGFALDRLATAVEWARSVRPVHVAAYASVRFDAAGAEDPTALHGSPSEVAAGMVDLARRLDADTIGLALVDGTTPIEHVGRAIEAIARYRDLERAGSTD